MQQETNVQGLRLSPQQKQLWLFQQHGPIPHAQAAVRIEGDLNMVALQEAIRNVIARHESLRTRFYHEPGMKVPFQVILDQADLDWQCIDLRHLEQQQEDAITEQLESLRNSAVDWERGPLLHAICCLLRPRRYALLLDVPALCADGRSLRNLVTEVWQGYIGSSVDEQSEGPVQYVQFSEWQNELLTDDGAEQGERFWAQQKLSSVPAVTLPFERPGGGHRSPATMMIERNVPYELMISLEQVAEDRHTSIAIILFACWQTLLTRVTRQQNLVCWWLYDGRSYDELQDGVGLFERWLPLQSRFERDMPFTEVVSRVVAAHAQAGEWQEYYFDHEHANGLNAVTDPIGFEYERRLSSWQADGMLFALERSHVCTRSFKLRLACRQDDASIRLVWHYDSERLSGEGLEPLADQFMQLVQTVVTQSGDAIDTLSILGNAERERLLRTFNSTVRSSPSAMLLHHMVEQQARQRPDAPALVAGDSVLTYDELNSKANQVAHGLMRRGIGRGACVGLCLKRSAGMIVGLLGVLKSGAAYVPVDPAQAAVRLVPHMTQSEASVLLVESHGTSWQSDFNGTTLSVTNDFQQEPSHDPQSTLSPDDLAYVIYTSGSTGIPKGVAVTHRNAMNYTHALCRQLQVREPGHFATVSTLSADLGNTSIFTSLASGGCLHVITYETATDGRLFSAYLARHPIDVLKIVPSHFKALLATADGGGILPQQYLILGGELLSFDLVEQVAGLGHCEVINHYGPTESTVGALTHRVFRSTARRLSVNVPIGCPIDNVEAYILDERLDPVPVGVAGELYLGGAGLARGYLGQPDRTAERFVPHPYPTTAGARLYRTGDLARHVPDGTIEFLGRIDHQVKIRGFRIELGEIETCLSECPSVREAVVVTRNDESGDTYLVAYLVTRGTESHTSAIQEFLRARLPEYMIPVKMLCLAAMPLTPNGKIDRRALPEPDQSEQSGKQFVAPRTPTEDIIAGLWCQVLKRDRVGVHDNFFDLGGHSLLATQVMSRLRTVFSVELPLRTLFEAATVARLAEAVQQAGRSESTSDLTGVVPVDRNGPLPLSFAQQRLWVLAQLEPEGTAYNISVALRVTGPLDVEALRRSFSEVVQRHEVLRTTFTMQDGAPVQVILPSLTVPLPVIDLEHLPESEREEAGIRLAGSEAHRPFDLGHGPMLRLSAIRLRAEEHVILVTMHHIVSDAWSAQILVGEVNRLYEAFAEGRPSPLSPLSIQYGDFSQWQRTWLNGAVLERELDYWKDVLGGDLPILMLPTDRPRPVIQSSHGALETVTLPADLSLLCKELSRRTGMTLSMTFLTAWYLLLFRYTGQEDLIVGTPIANRNRKEIEGLIGFFVNTLALRVDVSGNPTVKDVLGRVREVCLDAYAHQDIPFEKLVEVLQPVRNVGLSPIFQVMFDFQNASPPPQDIGGLQFVPLEVESHSAKFDLSMTVLEMELQFEVALEYNTDLFDTFTIRRMLGHFQELLQGMVAQSDRSIVELPLLSESETQQLVVEWNATERPTVSHGFAQLFEAQALRSPAAVAVRCGPRTMTYREVDDETHQLAKALRARGIGPETMVAVLEERGISLLLMMVAIFKAGGVYVPLDPSHPDQRLIRALEISGAAYVVARHDAATRLSRYVGQMPHLRAPAFLTIEQLVIAGDQAPIPSVGYSPEQLAYVIFTSGSTGMPKGAMVEQKGMLNHLLEKCSTLDLSSGDVVAQTASQCFDISIWQFLAALLCGAEVCIIRNEIAHDPSLLIAYLAEAEVTILETVPVLMQGLLDVSSAGTERALPKLRWLLPTGEAVSPALCRQWFARYPQIPLMNAYGPAECSDDVALHSITTAPSEDMFHVPIGRPVANTQLYVLSSALTVMPVGVPGELCVGGVGVGRGYLNDPERTAAVFVPDPFSDEPGGRLYRTGDRARYGRDGLLEFLGRADHQVKLRGFRIELGEIESILLRWPAAHEAVVVVREDRLGDKRLVAYVVVELGTASDVAGLRAFLREHLPEYMIPSAYVWLDRLPRNQNGKVDRLALSMPDVESGMAERSVAPRSAKEELLATVWADVLGVKRVSIHDNFFDLGGHSLLAVQLVARLQQSIGTPISLLALFQHSTVAALAEYLDHGHEDSASPLVALQSAGSRDPLYCIDPTGTHVLAYQPLAYALGNDQPVYGIALSKIFAAGWMQISIASMAEEFVRVIRCHQPNGPYRILGWSNGGVTALAIARALEREGQEVAFLGILDTQLPVHTYADENVNVIDEILAYIQRDRHQEFMALPEEERQALRTHLTSLSEDERVEYAIRWAQARQFLSKEESQASVEALKIGYALDRDAACLLNAFQPRSLQAAIHVWWTGNTLIRHGGAPIDWHRYTDGSVKTYTIDGDHMDAVQSIQVYQRISEILSGVDDAKSVAQRTRGCSSSQSGERAAPSVRREIDEL
jgi:amino acid adenylation domain-containing protein